jgi:hypothetical protein
MNFQLMILARELSGDGTGVNNTLPPFPPWKFFEQLRLRGLSLMERNLHIRQHLGGLIVQLDKPESNEA